jgi:hypothetical protein
MGSPQQDWGGTPIGDEPDDLLVPSVWQIRMKFVDAESEIAPGRLFAQPISLHLV